MFLTAYSELNRMARLGDGSITETQGKALARQIGWSASREGLRLERGLSFKTTFGNVLTLTPPLTVTENEMAHALDIVEACIAECAA